MSPFNYTGLDEQQIQEIEDMPAPDITSIINTISISWKDEDGKFYAVKSTDLDESLQWIAPTHKNVDARLYVEKMIMGGVPDYKVVGCLTKPFDNNSDNYSPVFIEGMYLAEEYYAMVQDPDRPGHKAVKYQIWINEQDRYNIKIIIPSGPLNIIKAKSIEEAPAAIERRAYTRRRL